MAHVLVAWEVSADSAERNAELRAALKGALKGRSWVRVLTDVHVVKVSSVEARATLKDALLEVAKAEGDIHIIVTPLMVGGSYSGWLPKRLWPKVRERTQEDG